MGTAITGFFIKFFSATSIVSRIIRTLAAGNAYLISVGIPKTGTEWVAFVSILLATMIPAGENQSAPATPSAKKAIPPAA